MSKIYIKLQSKMSVNFMTKILLDHIKKDQYATRRFQILTYFL